MVAFHSVDLQQAYTSNFKPLAERYLNHIEELNSFTEDVKTLQAVFKKHDLPAVYSDDTIEIKKTSEYELFCELSYRPDGVIRLRVAVVDNEGDVEEIYGGPLLSAKQEYREFVLKQELLCLLLMRASRHLELQLDDTKVLYQKPAKKVSIADIAFKEWQQEEAGPIDQ